MVGGNGVALVLLKPLAAALADGDPIHAVIRSIAANMQAIAEKLEKLQAQNVPAEAPKPEADGENQETHKVSLKK